jgi:hypothetical protein
MTNITATNITIDGHLSADGYASSGGGGGSGGSIYILANYLLMGSGFVSANGAGGSENAGSGSGGRIAVYFYNATSFLVAPRWRIWIMAWWTWNYIHTLATGYKTLYISNDNYPETTTRLITTMESANGYFAWLTESGIYAFDFDEIQLGNNGNLAVNPTEIANQSVSYFIPPNLSFIFTLPIYNCELGRL